MKFTIVFLIGLFLLLPATGCHKTSEPSTQNQSQQQADQAQDLTGAPAFVLKSSGTEYDDEIGDWVFPAIDQARELLKDQEAGFNLKTSTIRVRIVPRARGHRKGGARKSVNKHPASFSPKHRHTTTRKAKGSAGPKHLKVVRRPGVVKVRQIQKLDTYNVILAVVNVHQAQDSDPKIEFVKVDKNGRPSTEGFRVVKGDPLGMGTTYEVVAPRGYVVLAIKRVVRLDKKYIEVINTPYSAALDVPIVRKKGYDYLVKQITDAQTDLREHNVRSQVFGTRLVADLVPIRVSLALSIIEHVDPFIWERNAQKVGESVAMAALANKALVVVGANRKWSSAFAVSKAGARGLFQFIPRTYGAIRQRYSAAGLNPSFEDGMNDHENAAKASLLLFDSDWSFVQNSQRDFFAGHPDALGMYLAAAYNGGAGRAARAIQDYDKNWTTHVLPETQLYIRKFQALNAIMAQK